MLLMTEWIYHVASSSSDDGMVAVRLVGVADRESASRIHDSLWTMSTHASGIAALHYCIGARTHAVARYSTQQ
ncbi:hypothetical protein CBOM_07782 [Ceraceosorus bombacis]|uniref:Uncharacterized protein n=1 Tax=Ceraceosorus bombacis TaxID=401625 RepID=A0A0P1BND6_9BASI|nr:hypothetical protein CBOM_07782 [Ceraceosorus bombacis]